MLISIHYTKKSLLLDELVHFEKILRPMIKINLKMETAFVIP